MLVPLLQELELCPGDQVKAAVAAIEGEA